MYDALGVKVYANADSTHDDNPALTKSIRKMKRAVIESNGGGGPNLKQIMKGTSYTTGRVYWKGERVAEWDWAKGQLILKGSGAGYEVAYKKLMGIALG